VVEYAAAHGNCLVPAKYKLADGYRLGQWVNAQRISKATMPPERTTRLEALDGWAWNQRDAAWDAGFRQLAEYAATNGDCLVPTKYKLADGYRLGSWVNVQRTDKATMPPERKARLEALPGWRWKVREGK
jgi:hypothetical protein